MKKEAFRLFPYGDGRGGLFLPTLVETAEEKGACPEWRLRLFREDGFLWWEAARGEDPVDVPWREGKFREELWRDECVELFLAGPTGSPYLEWNLAPGGDWWFMRFHEPRNHAPPGEAESLPVKAFGRMNQSGWSARMGVPIDYLEEMLGVAMTEWLANATAIFPTAQGRRFFSLAALPDPQPDFHRPDAFLPLVGEDTSRL